MKLHGEDSLDRRDDRSDDVAAALCRAWPDCAAAQVMCRLQQMGDTQTGGSIAGPIADAAHVSPKLQSLTQSIFSAWFVQPQRQRSKRRDCGYWLDFTTDFPCRPRSRFFRCGARQQLRGDFERLGYASYQSVGGEKVSCSAAADDNFSASAHANDNCICFRAFSWCGMDLLYELKEGSR